MAENDIDGNRYSQLTFLNIEDQLRIKGIPVTPGDGSEPLTTMKFVDNGTVSTTRDGSIENPYNEISEALTDITDAATGKRYVLIVAPGSYASFTAKPFVFVIAYQKDSSNVGTITIPNTVGTYYFQDMLTSSITTANMTVAADVNYKGCTVTSASVIFDIGGATLNAYKYDFIGNTFLGDLTSSGAALSSDFKFIASNWESGSTLTAAWTFNVTTDDNFPFEGNANVTIVDRRSKADVIEAAGSNNQIQFNNGGPIGASANLIFNGNQLGVGPSVPSTPDGTIHAHTGSAGSISASSFADDLVVENSTDAGMAILSPDADSGSLEFGSPSRQTGCFVRWNFDLNLMNIGTGNTGAEVSISTSLNSEVARFNSEGNLSLTRTVDDTLPVLSLNNTGTNPGEANIFIGDRTPAGNVTGESADLYIRKGNGGTAVFINKGTSPNTDSWCFLKEQCAFAAGTQSGNATPTNIITQNVYETPAGSLTASGNEFNATVNTMGITYTGPSTISSTSLVAWNITAEKAGAGAAETYEFIILKNGSQIGASVGAELDEVEPETLTAFAVTTLTNGDVFDISVRCTTAIDDVLISDQTLLLD